MSTAGMIAVTGLVGVGKTTLARNLALRLKAKLILEEYDENPFLAQQVAGDSGSAILSELFFLLSRARQLDRTAITEAGLVVTDYLFDKNRLFAELFLDAEQFALYDQVEQIVRERIAQPSLVIYLHDTVDNCLDRINCRGRDFEQSISRKWLDALDRAYTRLFEDWTICPLLPIDCSKLDLRTDAATNAILAHFPNRWHAEDATLPEMS